MLSGNLELFALTDVLRFVARSGATGSVNIYRPTDAGRILLADGHVVGAVVADYAATDPDGVVDAVLRLMDGGGGDFALELEPVDGPTDQPVEDFLKAVGRRRAEWRKILGSIGSLDHPLEVTALVPSGSDEITLTPVEWQIAVMVDGNRTLRDVAQEAGASEFVAATALLAMSNAGLLSLPGAPGDSGDAGSDEEEPADETDDSFSYDEPEEGPQDEAADESADEPTSDDEELDPAELLRELGEQRTARARTGRGTHPTREEQRIRLRSR